VPSGNHAASLSACPPTLQILDDRHSAGTCDDPLDLRIPLIDLLMLGVSRDQGKVAFLQDLSLLPALRHDRSSAANTVDDRILVAVVVDGG